jgi:hypothetical protein
LQWTLVGDDTSGAIVGADQAKRDRRRACVRRDGCPAHGHRTITVRPIVPTSLWARIFRPRRSRRRCAGDACAAPVAIAAEPRGARTCHPARSPLRIPIRGPAVAVVGVAEPSIVVAARSRATCRLLRRSRVGSC